MGPDTHERGTKKNRLNTLQQQGNCVVNISPADNFGSSGNTPEVLVRFT